jgi:pimeloyl-ACP methyl ester carboxylesterase
MHHPPNAGPTSRVCFSQRLRLHYVDWGNSEADPLILLHGGLDHCRSWDDVAEHLRSEWHVIAPDLRGHGDSQWSSDGFYTMPGYIYDLAQLIHSQRLAPVTIIAHSLGGNIALRYAGLYPATVKRLVAIEGLGPSPKARAERARTGAADRFRAWVSLQRELAGRLPRRYQSLEEAVARMQQANTRLRPEQARHLTRHGVNQNEDGTYSWKFDNYLRVWPPYDLPEHEVEELWKQITCPTLLVYGEESWASNPAQDGRARHFARGEVVLFKDAGHWVHHDQLREFIATVRRFLCAGK